MKKKAFLALITFTSILSLSSTDGFRFELAVPKSNLFDIFPPKDATEDITGSHRAISGSRSKDLVVFFSPDTTFEYQTSTSAASNVLNDAKKQLVNNRNRLEIADGKKYGYSIKTGKPQKKKAKLKYETTVSTPINMENEHSNESSEKEPRYNFIYQVSSAETDSFSHSRMESRSGKKLRGQYKVRLPDGRVQERLGTFNCQKHFFHN